MIRWNRSSTNAPLLRFRELFLVCVGVGLKMGPEMFFNIISEKTPRNGSHSNSAFVAAINCTAAGEANCDLRKIQRTTALYRASANEFIRCERWHSSRLRKIGRPYYDLSECMISSAFAVVGKSQIENICEYFTNFNVNLPYCHHVSAYSICTRSFIAI